MSYKNFELGTRKIEQNFEIISKDDITNDLINQVALALGLELSKQHYNYLKKYGFIMFSGTSLYGIYHGVFDGIYADNLVVATLEERRERSLKASLLPIYDVEDEGIAFLDYSQINDDGEPPVILFQYQGEDSEWVEIERLANDLGDFLLQLVEEQLANQ